MFIAADVHGQPQVETVIQITNLATSKHHDILG